MRHFKETHYLVHHRDKEDDETIPHLIRLGMLGRTRSEAWKKFLKTAGGSRATWNKFGYIAQPILITYEYQNPAP